MVFDFHGLALRGVHGPPGRTRRIASERGSRRQASSHLLSNHRVARPLFHDKIKVVNDTNDVHAYIYRPFCLKSQLVIAGADMNPPEDAAAFGVHRQRVPTTSTNRKPKISSYRSKEARDGERGMSISEGGIYSYNVCLYIAAFISLLTWTS